MNRHDKALRALLRAHDPASGMEELSEVERSRMRQIVVSSRPHRVRVPTRWMMVTASAAMLAVVIGAGLWVASRLAAKPEPPHRASRTQVAPDAVQPAARQIQFSAPGGTRIVWILNPDLQL